jgi:hypothetical protein
MPSNTIKVKQIDNADLLAFLQANLGLSIGVDEATHSFDESFQGVVTVQGPFTVSGQSYFTGLSTFKSGIVSDGNLTVNSLISGQSLAIQNFNLPSGAFQSINIGALKLTGVPIYESGNATVAVGLPSGTVFGLRQIVNAPTFDRDASGQLMPATGSGTFFVMLCVSVGS